MYAFCMDIFLKTQLNRACYVSLLKNNEVIKGIEEFGKYIKKLNFLSLNPFLFKKCFDEKKKAKSIFLEKLEKIAKQYLNDEKYSKAQNIYKIILEKDTKNLENIRNYIICLNKLEQYDISLKLAKYLVKKTKKFDDYKLFADILSNNNYHKEAIDVYKNALEINNKEYDLDDYTKLGCYYFNLNKVTKNSNDIKQAQEYFSNALKLAPKNKSCLKNLISATAVLKQTKLQKALWEKYMEFFDLTKEEEFSYSACCMEDGDIELWEKYYEARYEDSNMASGYLSTSKPRYDGTQDISDKTLLVFSEQGFGDTILMFGYMKRLVKIAKKVIFHTRDELYELFKNNDLGIEVYSSKNVQAQDIEHDYFILCMSIPHALKLTKENISVGSGYIKPDENLVQKYKQKYFEVDKLKIGLAFKGNVSGPCGRNIQLKDLKILDKLKNVQFYCFTKDIEDKDLKVFKKNKVINIAKDFSDFNHTAAAMQNLDILISTDNGVLNLAGAIGKKTFGLFNFNFEFRWYDLTGNDCGWFDCVKPFVNDTNDDWSINLEKVVKEVELIQKSR